MKQLQVLVIGGGIGGLTSAIALRQRGFEVTVIEKGPDWSVYGVGIIQQGNVIRAMKSLGLVDAYLAAGVGFDAVEVFAPDGTKVARVPSPQLEAGYPANLGIGRPALHKVLGDATISAGADVRLGVTAKSIEQTGERVLVAFSDGSQADYDLVIGADGVHSATRSTVFPEAPGAEYTGQAVWRYNLPRLAGLDVLQVYNGSTGVGLVPISRQLMYMYITTPESGNPWYEKTGLAKRMKDRLADCAPVVRELGEQITDDEEVVYRPLEALMVTGNWHNDRVVLLGDALHTTTPHLGQGAGMAIEDSLVLAEELASHEVLDSALTAYRERRIERCRYIVEKSLAICHGQIGKGPLVDNASATAEMFEVVSAPI